MKVVRNFLLLTLMSVSVLVFGQTEDTEDVSPKVKVHRFPGGICYSQRKPFEPDMVTYVTTLPELLHSSDIEKCIAVLKNKKWIATPLEPQTSANTFREVRTENIVCTRWGGIQSLMFYQVRFSDYMLTGKSKELIKCLTLIATAKDLLIKESDTKFHPARTNTDDY